MTSITFLGTGTSTGVPQIGCKCNVCLSADARDKRLRSSVLISTPRSNFLIDAGPDFRAQLIAAGAPPISSVLLTHSHYDHVGGIDDMRPYCANQPMPVYCTEDVKNDLLARIPYCFAEHLYPGVPTFDIHTVTANKPFIVNNETVLPIHVMHAKLPILGYRIGNVAYITDCKILPEISRKLLHNLDVLIINALRYMPHPSHLSLDEALEIISELQPKRSYLTHISHQLAPHAAVELPENVWLAYDGLQITAE